MTYERSVRTLKEMHFIVVALLIATMRLCASLEWPTRNELRVKLAASLMAATSYSATPLIGASHALDTEEVIRECGNIEFSLSYIGSGGSGTVFKGIPTSGIKGSKDPKVVKVSRSASEAGVRKEGVLLRELRENGVDNIERLVTSCDNMRVRDGVDGYAIVLEPYLNPPEAPSIASIKDDDDGFLKAKASRALLKTCIQFISSNVYLTDLQILVEPGATGRMLIIDLTEAERLHLGEEPKLSFSDKTAISSFLGECISFVEEAVSKSPNENVGNRIKAAAIAGFQEGVDSSQRKERLSPEVLEVIQEYITTRLG